MSKAAHSTIPSGVRTMYVPAWTRKPRRYWTSTKNQEIQILLISLLSLWTLRDVPDGKSQQLEWTSLIPAGKAGLFSAVSVLPSALSPPDHQSQQTKWHPNSSRSLKPQQTRLSSVHYATDGTRHVKIGKLGLSAKVYAILIDSQLGSNRRLDLWSLC